MKNHINAPNRFISQRTKDTYSFQEVQRVLDVISKEPKSYWSIQHEVQVSNLNAIITDLIKVKRIGIAYHSACPLKGWVKPFYCSDMLLVEKHINQSKYIFYLFTLFQLTKRSVSKHTGATIEDINNYANMWYWHGQITFDNGVSLRVKRNDFVKYRNIAIEYLRNKRDELVEQIELHKFELSERLYLVKCRFRVLIQTVLEEIQFTYYHYRDLFSAKREHAKSENRKKSRGKISENP